MVLKKFKIIDLTNHDSEVELYNFRKFNKLPSLAMGSYLSFAKPAINPRECQCTLIYSIITIGMYSLVGHLSRPS
jgi:hypothetical protein